MSAPVRFALSLALCLSLPGCKTSSQPPPAEPTTPVAAATDPRPEAPAPVGPEAWIGAIELPTSKMQFVVRFTPPADPKGEWSGRIDMPAQGIKDFPLKDVALAPDAIDFVLAPPGAPEAQWVVFSFEREGGAGTGKGTLAQFGSNLPVTIRRLAEGESADLTPKRPQEPKAPFPYAAREASFTSAAADKVALAGTLTVPSGAGPFPAVVLLTGSGAQDRDEALMGHKPFLVIADHLTRAGFAVLRFDDRGVGGSKGQLDRATQADLAGDARGALDWLTQQPEIDRARLGVVGHSEGAWVAAKIGALDKRVRAVVMLAGPGVAGREILPQQLVAIARARGVAQAEIDAQVAQQKELLAALLANKPRADLEAILRKLVPLQQPGIAPDQAEALVKASLGQLDTPWFRDFIKADPRPDLRKLKAPVLALIGALDLQVPAADNIPELERALKANKAAVIKTLPGLNHLFQRAKTGAPSEYGDIEETFAPEALAELTTWLRATWPAS
jgi:hypothetical protein